MALGIVKVAVRQGNTAEQQHCNNEQTDQYVVELAGIGNLHHVKYYTEQYGGQREGYLQTGKRLEANTQISGYVNSGEGYSDKVGNNVAPGCSEAPEFIQGLGRKYVNATGMGVSYGQLGHLNAIATEYYSCNYPCNYSCGTGIVHSHAGK